MPRFCSPPSGDCSGPAASGKAVHTRHAPTNLLSSGRHVSQPALPNAPFPLTSPTARPHQTANIRPRVPGLSCGGRKEKLAPYGGTAHGSPTRYLAAGGHSHAGRRSRIRRSGRRRRRGRAAPQRL